MVIYYFGIFMFICFLFDDKIFWLTMYLWNFLHQVCFFVTWSIRAYTRREEFYCAIYFCLSIIHKHTSWVNLHDTLSIGSVVLIRSSGLLFDHCYARSTNGNRKSVYIGQNKWVHIFLCINNQLIPKSLAYASWLFGFKNAFDNNKMYFTYEWKAVGIPQYPNKPKGVIMFVFWFYATSQCS